jgi:superfamily II helicase
MLAVMLPRRGVGRTQEYHSGLRYLDYYIVEGTFSDEKDINPLFLM